VNLYRNADARPEQQQFITVLREKCAFKGIELPSNGFSIGLDVWSMTFLPTAVDWPARCEGNSRRRSR
jgi:hypothetical protein